MILFTAPLQLTVKQVVQYTSILRFLGAFALLLPRDETLGCYCCQQALHQREALLVTALRRKQVEQQETDAELEKELRLTTYLKNMRVAFVVQDCVDLFQALSDITDGKSGVFAHPVILNAAALVSASVSTYKYWNAC